MKTHLPIWLGSTFRSSNLLPSTPSTPLLDKLNKSSSFNDLNPDNRKYAIEIMLLEQDAINAANEKRFTDCIKSLERSLSTRLSLFPSDDPDTHDLCHRICAQANTFAIKLLSMSHFDTSLDLLKKVEYLTEGSICSFPQRLCFRAVTFNNLACYFRRRSKLNAALSFCQKAIKIENKISNPNNYGGSLFNLGVILSQLGKHDESLKVNYKTVSVFQEEIMKRSSKGDDDVSSNIAHYLASTHHNCGIEQLRLHKFSDAILCLRRALAVGQEYSLDIVLMGRIRKVLEDLTTGATSSGLKLPPIEDQKSRLPVNNSQDDDVTPPVFDPFRTLTTPAPPPKSSQYVRKRAVFEMKSFNVKPSIIAQKDAAVVVQSVIRGFLARRELACKRHQAQNELDQHRLFSALLVQRVLRGFICRRRLKNDEELRRNAHNDLNRQEFDPLVLDSTGKGFIRKKAILKVKKIQEEAQKEAAALLIQSVFRGYLGREYFKFLIRKRDEIKATIIQSLIRGFLIRKQSNQLQMKVIYLQSIFRGVLTRKQVKSQSKSAILIQRLVRGFLYRSVYLKQQSAAIIIQSNIRRFLTKKDFLRKVSATFTLQRYFKGIRTRQRYYLLQDSTILLQSVIRMFLDKCRVFKLNNSAIVIQSNFRRFSVRKSFSTLRVNTIYLQSVIRMFLDKQRYFGFKQSITLLQSLIKSKLAQHHRIRDVNNVVKYQALVKGFLAKKDHSRKIQSVVLFQSNCKRFLIEQMIFKMNSSAVVIQKTFKRFYYQKQYRCCLEKYYLIRSLIKMHLCRAQFRRERRSSVVIQSQLRKYLACKAFKQLLASTIKLQSVFKGYLSRQRLKVELDAAIVIQSVIRRFNARQNYLKILQSSLLISSTVRMHLGRLEFQKLKFNCVKIQSLIRTYNDRKNYQILKSSTILIQSIVRKFLSKRGSFKQQSAAISIQSSIRGFLVRAGFNRQVITIRSFSSGMQAVISRRKFQDMQRKSVLIQSLIRKFIIKRRNIQVWHCFNCIQCLIKFSLCRRKFKNLQQSTITIQKTVRGYLSRRQYFNMIPSLFYLSSLCHAKISRENLRKQLKSFTLIQCAFKSSLAQRQFTLLKSMNIRLREHSVAAVIIQSVFRGYLARQNFNEKLTSLIFLQSAIRTTFVQNQMNFNKQCIEACQSKIKSHFLKQSLRNRLGLVCLLQSIIRCGQSRRYYLCNVAAMTLFASAARSSVTRSKFLIQRSKSVVIQSIIRGFLTRKNLALVSEKETEEYAKFIAKIQNWSRTIILCKKLQESTSTVQNLQKMIRSCQCQNIHLQNVNSIRFYQSLVRTLLYFKRFNLDKHSLKTAQNQIPNVSTKSSTPQLNPESLDVADSIISRLIISTVYNNESSNNPNIWSGHPWAFLPYQTTQELIHSPRRVDFNHFNGKRATRRHSTTEIFFSNEPFSLNVQKNRNDAAVKIQSLWRGYVVRQRFELLRYYVERCKASFRSKRDASFVPPKIRPPRYPLRRFLNLNHASKIVVPLQVVSTVNKTSKLNDKVVYDPIHKVLQYQYGKLHSSEMSSSGPGRPPSRMIKSRLSMRDRPFSAMSVRSNKTIPHNHQFPATPALVRDSLSSIASSPPESISSMAEPSNFVLLDDSGDAKSPVRSMGIQFKVGIDDAESMLTSRRETLKSSRTRTVARRRGNRRNTKPLETPLATPR
ncbi:hypothetical protein P9112_005636 [Eukaryota sp. TZLM1-RC]